jgi:hypothetical protein
MLPDKLIATSSSCPQLFTPHGLCTHIDRNVSLPLHSRSSNQMGPFLPPNDRPFNTDPPLK